MVKTKSVYDEADQSDGQRILVTRFWPRGISKARLSVAEWMREPAPSVALLRDWKAGRISWDEYTVRYHAEMAAHEAAIADLRERARVGTITLLCFEREGNPHCHRHLLKKLIEQETPPS
jgi:uncharacterized protein YeaO (DUF488 family)